MPEFTDSRGERWEVTVTGGTVKRAQEHLKIDLGEPLAPTVTFEQWLNDKGLLLDELDETKQHHQRFLFAQSVPPLLTRFDTDIAFKVDLLYVVCMPEAKKRDITDEDFAERLEGDALYHASEAYTAAWADFFRSLRRPDLVAAIEKQREQIRKIWTAGAELVTSDALTKKLDDDLEELGNSFANSLQSPEPTPSHGPSES